MRPQRLLLMPDVPEVREPVVADEAAGAQLAGATGDHRIAADEDDDRGEREAAGDREPGRRQQRQPSRPRGFADGGGRFGDCGGHRDFESLSARQSRLAGLRPSVSWAPTSSTATLHHWIDGAPDASAAARFGEVTESATGRGRGTRAVRDRRDASIAPCGRPPQAAAVLGPELDQPAQQGALRLPRAGARPPRRAGGDRHARARQGARRRAGRGPARPGGRRVRLRRRAAPQGRADAGRLPRASTPTRCASRVGVVAGITPFNFPIMVPMWMHPVAIACGNAFVLKPSEQDPSASLRVAELWAQAGLPAGRLHGRPRRQGGGRRAACPSAGRRGLVRRLDADRPLCPRDAAPRTASACRRSAAPRTTRSSCPTPTSSSPPTASSRPATARPASAAWRSRSPSRSATVADAADGPASASGSPR